MSPLNGPLILSPLDQEYTPLQAKPYLSLLFLAILAFLIKKLIFQAIHPSFLRCKVEKLFKEEA